MPQTIAPSLWVFFGTDLPYPVSIQQSNFFDQARNPQTGHVMMMDTRIGKPFLLEKITEYTLRERQEFYSKNFWVETDGKNLYKGFFDIRSLTEPKMRNGQIVGGNLLLQDGSSISLELISKIILTMRNNPKNMVWVDLVTGELYPYLVSGEKFTEKEIKRGVRLGTLLLDDDSTIWLEQMGKSVYNRRVKRAIEAIEVGKTSTQWSYIEPAIEPNIEPAIEPAEELERVWIELDTGKLYTNYIDVEHFFVTKVVDDLIVGGRLTLQDRSTLSLAFVPKKDVPSYKKFWVKTGTDNIFSYPDNPFVLESNRTQTGILQQKLLLEDLSIVSVERISRDAHYKRKSRLKTQDVVNTTSSTQADDLQFDAQPVSENSTKKPRYEEQPSPTFFGHDFAENSLQIKKEKPSPSFATFSSSHVAAMPEEGVYLKPDANAQTQSIVTSDGDAEFFNFLKEKDENLLDVPNEKDSELTGFRYS